MRQTICRQWQVCCLRTWALPDNARTFSHGNFYSDHSSTEKDCEVLNHPQNTVQTCQIVIFIFLYHSRNILVALSFRMMKMSKDVLLNGCVPISKTSTQMARRRYERYMGQVCTRKKGILRNAWGFTNTSVPFDYIEYKDHVNLDLHNVRVCICVRI